MFKFLRSKVAIASHVDFLLDTTRGYFNGAITLGDKTVSTAIEKGAAQEDAPVEIFFMYCFLIFSSAKYALIRGWITEEAFELITGEWIRRVRGALPTWCAENGLLKDDKDEKIYYSTLSVIAQYDVALMNDYRDGGRDNYCALFSKRLCGDTENYGLRLVAQSHLYLLGGQMTDTYARHRFIE
jgi:hypothetical protein